MVSSRLRAFRSHRGIPSIVAYAFSLRLFRGSLSASGSIGDMGIFGFCGRSSGWLRTPSAHQYEIPKSCIEKTRNVEPSDIQDYFSFTTTTRNVRFLLTGLTTDVDIQILDSFGRAVAAGTSGSLTTEDITVNALAAGSYFIRVFAFSVSSISNYSLSVN